MSALLTLMLLAPQSLTLQQATDQALEGNPNLKQVQERAMQAELLIWRAWTTILPRVTLSAQITRNNQEITFGMPNMDSVIAGIMAQAQGQPAPPVETEETVIQEKWGQQYSLTASIPLFSARAWPLKNGAEDTVEMSRLQARYAELELRHAVAGAFLATRAAEEAARLSATSVGTAMEGQKLAEARLERGVGLKIEVLAAKMEVNEADAARADAEGSVEMAKAGMRAITGLSGDLELVGEFRPQASASGVEGSRSRALKERLDLKALAYSARIAQHQETLTKTQFLPTVDLTYNYTWSSAAGFGGENGSWRLIFGATWVLFEGSDRFAVLKSQASDTRQARLQYEAQQRQITQEVEEAWVEIDRRRRAHTLAEERALLAEERHRWAKKHFEEGLSHKVDLFEASQALRQAKLAALLAQLQLDLAWLQLRRVEGLPPTP